MLDRRTLLRAACGALAVPHWAAHTAAEDEAAAVAALRAGGTVAAFRHALAPGTLDPPGFRLGDCSTQRNLDAAGRAQARRLGAWFAARGLAPRAVRSSPWCRCLETARLAFGERVEAWDALGSLREGDPAAQLPALRAALASLRPGGFEVWVSHQFTLSALVGTGTASGEGLVLAGRPGGARPAGAAATSVSAALRIIAPPTPPCPWTTAPSSATRSAPCPTGRCRACSSATSRRCCRARGCSAC